jgi:hypothetical protein
MIPPRYNIKDKIITKKQHPCGGNEWEIIRTGADFKLKCLKCGKVILLSYEEVVKRTKKLKPYADSEK